MNGAFLTSREIFGNPIWQNVVDFRLFFLIYGMAVFAEEGARVAGKHLQRGQWLRSIRNIQDDLEYIENRQVKRYSVSVIKRSIDRLVMGNRIQTEVTDLGTLFTVINYDVYQGLSNYKADNLEQRWNSVGTAEEQSGNNNNNANNVKKGYTKKEIDYTEEFERFWAAYPRPIEKKASFTTWTKLMKEKADPELIIRCAMNYKNYCEINNKDKEHIKHPSTFMNKERYKDFSAPFVLQGGNIDPISRIIKQYEKKIGPVGSSQKESLSLYCETFTPEWVEQAIDINYKHNKRSREEILITLKEWKRSGQTEPWIYEEAIP